LGTISNNKNRFSVDLVSHSTLHFLYRAVSNMAWRFYVIVKHETMPYLKTTGVSPVQLFYQDLGKGIPVIFIHGWPSTHEMWEYQMEELSKHYRCITYDRRGFGHSAKPWKGYDYDTLAADLKAVIDTLELNNVTLVGFSMGGGEVARYIGNYGSDKIQKIVLISSVTPFMLQAPDNEDGVPKEIFDDMVNNIREDRPKFLAGFGKVFFGIGLLNHPLSDELLQWAHGLTLQATQISTIECLHAFAETDFRANCAAIDVPTLIIHGDADKTVPIEISAKKTALLIKNAQLKIYEDAPHGLFITERKRLTEDLLDFIGEEVIADLVGEKVTI
jgi:pimeloyl-ACP methyl ester carboxylesterase